MPVTVKWGAASHPGQVRMNNEDAFAADDGMWVVADGMGGHLAGEVASAYTIDALREANRTGITSSDDLVVAVQQANDLIRHEALTNPGRRGMGTTVTALAVMHHPDNPQLVIANVGDSRTYLWRDEQLQTVTIDHSYVQELVSGGEITVEEARTHPRRNIVTRALGIEPAVMVDTWTFGPVRGDRYLLCSDGLVDEVTDEEIAAIVGSEPDPQQVADRLVTLANEHGGRDNVTVVVVDVVDGDVTPTTPLPLAPEVISTGDESTEEDDTARINRTLQIEAIAAAEALEPPVVLPPPDAEVYVDGAPIAAPATLAAAEPAATSELTSPRRRVSKAALAFWIVIAAIVVTVIVVIILALTGGDDEPAPTTSTSTSTTEVTTSTTAAPSTTSSAAPTTAASPLTTAPTTPATPTSASTP